MGRRRSEKQKEGNASRSRDRGAEETQRSAEAEKLKLEAEGFGNRFCFVARETGLVSEPVRFGKWANNKQHMIQVILLQGITGNIRQKILSDQSF
jgi:hypothetical protein